MRVLLFAGVMALAGCGGGALTGDAKVMHALCVSGGGAAPYCDCMTKELQTKLSPADFAQVAKGGTGSDPTGLFEVMAAADKVCAKP